MEETPAKQYIFAPADRIYHLALTNEPNERLTLCMLMITTDPDRRRRFGDRRLEADIPRNRVCVLCSECARRSGDNRSFKERVNYPKS